MEQLPAISVVVPVYNQAAILPITLPAIAAMRGAREVLLVDDGSTDGSDALLEEAAAASDELRVIRHPENRGRAAARNTGSATASGEVILFLDADIIPQPDLVTHHAKRYLDQSVIGVLSNDQPDALDANDPFHQYLLDRAGPHGIGADKPLPLRYFIAGYSSVRRTALGEVGGFDEEIGYGEDLDLAYRLCRRWPRGLRFEPAAVVHQRCIGDLDERIERLRLFGSNLPLLLSKHPGLAAAAGLTSVSSAARRALLRPATWRLARLLLGVAPSRARPHLIRLILASAVAAGFRDRHP